MLLTFGRELIERRFALNVVPSLKLEDIRNANPAMRADQTVRDPVLLEQRNHMWPRDVQKIGGLLRRELRVHRHDRDGVPVGHLAQDLQKQLERISRYPDAYVRCGPLGTDLHPLHRLPLAVEAAKETQRFPCLLRGFPNLKDFPKKTLEPLGLEAVHPDDFVLDSIDLAPAAICAVVEAQAASLKNPPQTVAELLVTLQRNGLVQSVARLRDLYAGGAALD